MGIAGEKLNGSNHENVKQDDSYKFKPFSFNLQLPHMVEPFPFPRSGHRIVCDDGNFYSFGGYNPNYLTAYHEANADADDELPHFLFPDVWKYNFALRKWRKLIVKDMPTALVSNCVVLSGRLLIVYGGTGVPFHLARSNKLYVCNLEEKEPVFQLVEGVGQVPPPLYGQALFMKNNYLYVMGGTTGFDYFMDIHRFNLKTKEWEEVYINKGSRNDPSGRYRHELAVVDDKVYVIGGGVGREAFDFDEISVFDIKFRKWEKLISIGDKVHGYPLPRQYHSVCKIPDTSSFVMVGGMYENTVFGDAWKLDIPSMQWTKLCTLQLSTPVYFHASCVTPSGKMYIFGGVSKTSGDTPERVSHIQSAWLCIPKLKELCWEAVTDNSLIDISKIIDSDTRLPFEYSRRLIL